MSHLQVVLPLPQRSAVKVFWKLLGHDWKDISWSSCPQRSWMVLHNKEITNLHAVTVLSHCAAVSITGSTWKIQLVLQPRCAALQHLNSKGVFCASFFSAAFSIAKWMCLTASWLNISDLQQLSAWVCCVVLMWEADWSKGVRTPVCCCGWCCLKQGSTAPRPVQKAPELDVYEPQQQTWISVWPEDRLSGSGNLT